MTLGELANRFLEKLFPMADASKIRDLMVRHGLPDASTSWKSSNAVDRAD